MKLRKWGAVCAAVALSIVGGTAVTSASAPRSPQVKNAWLGTTGSETIRGATRASASQANKSLQLIFVQKNFTDSGDPQSFYQFEVSGPVYNANETKKVGFAGVHCTLVDPKKGLAECEGTFNLGADFPGGNQITIQGFSSPATHWFNAITGGTGRYREADGEVEARNIGTTNKVEVTFHIG